VLRNVNLHVSTGFFSVLVGRNGAGKTTLMRTLMGLQQAEAGRISIDSRDTTSAPAYSHASHGVGYMPEDRRLIPHWTVEQNILFPVWVNNKVRADEVLDSVYTKIPELREHRHRRALQLSGGQQKLVAFARALACGTHLILLDEPFEGVAPVLAERLREALTELKRKTGVTVLVAESDLARSVDLFNDIFEIERGVVRKMKSSSP
jgi:branched-chain amino acid transport system ATP-binding protein